MSQRILCSSLLSFAFGESHRVNTFEKQRKCPSFLSTRLLCSASPCTVVCQHDGSAVLVSSSGQWLHPLTTTTGEPIADVSSATYVGEMERGTNVFVTGPGNVRPEFLAEGTWKNPRLLFGDLSEPELAALGISMSMHQWRASVSFCSYCGNHTRIRDLGMSVACTGCERVHYPSVSPAMIVAVLNGKGDVLLSQRRKQSFLADGGKVVRTVLAGFVSPGEPTEEAVCREVREEAGLTVSRVRYVGSQPWPFPSQLMSCYYAIADDSGDLCMDETELVSVGWVSKSDVQLALSGQHEEFVIPPSFTAAHTLLERWANGGVRDDMSDNI